MRLQFQCAHIDSNQGARASSGDLFIVYYLAPYRDIFHSLTRQRALFPLFYFLASRAGGGNVKGDIKGESNDANHKGEIEIY